MSYGSYRVYGDGVSSVENITKRIFEEDWRYLAEHFYPADSSVDSVFLEEGRQCQIFLKLIKSEIDSHLKTRGLAQSHYEDLYAAVYHIWHDEMEEIVSPLIARSIHALRVESAAICSKMRSTGIGDPFRTLLRYSLTLIQSVVLAELGRPVEPVQLEIISNLARKLGQMDVFTLNHDGLVERQLEIAGIPFTDGFEDRQDGYRIFSPNWDKASVRILKMHGSLNWTNCVFTKRDNSRFEQTAIFTRPVDKCLYEGNRIEVKNDFQFLTGTTVKENSYGYDIIGEMFSKFRELTCSHRVLVFCGYGWGGQRNKY